MNHPVNNGIKFVPVILIAGFVLAIAYALAEITWLILDEQNDIAVRKMNSPLSSSQTAVEKELYGNEMAEWNLFGKLEAPKAVEEKVVVKAPETRLQLVLKGVYVAPDSEKSSAIIADKRSAKRYRIGEKIPGGVSLHEVHSKFVILKRGAKYETLRFADKSLKAPITATPRVVSKPPRRAAKSGKRGIVSDIRSGRITSVQDILNDYGANPAEQLATVLMEAGMEPTSEGGESGLKVGANAPKDILKSIGLRSGDIVRSVNDFPVDELQGDDALLREILTSERAKIVIQRGSRRFTVNYPLPQG